MQIIGTFLIRKGIEVEEWQHVHLNHPLLKKTATQS